MNKYVLSEKYRYYSKSTTKGTQIKYKKDNYFYKLNRHGNEGFVEYLVSRLLINSTLPDYHFVSYEYCVINDRLGCRSKNFLSNSSDEFMSINSLYSKVTGKDNLSDYLCLLGSASERLNYILDLVEIFGINRMAFKDYINLLVQLDMLIINTDRHPHNYGVIYNNSTNSFSICPVFDNGLSLNTDRLGNNSSCTISGSFTEQVIAFGYPIKPVFKLQYNRIMRDLSRIENLYGKKNEIEVLRHNLEVYKSIFMLS